ncbi:hypothetical protein DK926_19010 [Rhodococcus sp. Eu-32]|uniref:hypothetical protein n=1 Tax=Rhodococcus sp. Eu-32 TaxID=1017319 RepID=UPI000DF359CE|nr:hypothetical protein [Rhodococcus sp. Eu-32]RRQ26333.1 hypothetical protein DK926_19010 [Rhodococcus sp. Eu-32]
MTNTENLASQTRKTVTSADILAGATYHGTYLAGSGEKVEVIELDSSLDAVFRRCGYSLPAKGRSRARKD